jgi:hypothetical protein
MHQDIGDAPSALPGRSYWATDETAHRLEPIPAGNLACNTRGMSSSSTTLEDLVELWRPTGPEEIDLVRASGSRRWPPRLPDQPIFYPVLNEDYATRIARDWNVKASGVGFVTRFRVRKSFLDRYDVQQVGGETILEYWIPAEDLEELNDNIVGTIEEVARFE